MPRETLKLGVIGLGEFGEAYLQLINGLRDVLDIETVAIASRSADRAADLADRFAIPRWYDDSVAFANDPDIDVVCVVTSEPSHADPATRALYAGKHVIVEKPIATTLADAIQKMRQRIAMTLAQEHEARIGGDRKRRFAQAVKIQIHACSQAGHATRAMIEPL